MPDHVAPPPSPGVLPTTTDADHAAEPLSRLVLLVLALALAGCAGTRPWINPPLAADAPAQAFDPRQLSRVQGADRLAVTGIVTLSGGGARAAAFAHGVLQELKATTVQ